MGARQPEVFAQGFRSSGWWLVAEVPGSSAGDGGKSVRVGGPARGYSWKQFEQGNTVASTHGAYSQLRLAPRAEQLAGIIRSQLDAADCERFSLLVSTAALIGARMESAFAAMLDPDDPASAERL